MIQYADFFDFYGGSAVLPILIIGVSGKNLKGAGPKEDDFPMAC